MFIRARSDKVFSDFRFRAPFRVYTQKNETRVLRNDIICVRIHYARYEDRCIYLDIHRGRYHTNRVYSKRRDFVCFSRHAKRCPPYTHTHRSTSRVMTNPHRFHNGYACVEIRIIIFRGPFDRYHAKRYLFADPSNRYSTIFILAHSDDDSVRIKRETVNRIFYKTRLN